MKAKIVLLWSLAVCVCTSFTSVKAEFILTVNLVNYTNPTGLCAECLFPLSDVASADNLVPVCCDELPFTNTNCNNIGEERCDTRFRWTIRPFSASLEARPSAIQNADNPPYFFTDCSMSSSTCPFSEMSSTFSQGSTALLGVTPNPLPVSDFTLWTGQLQFFIEAVDSGLPNIIDSLLINLDNLQLGADFTEEMTFTGYHNISHMTMSFRVECSPGFCGSDCTTTPQNNPRVATCQTDGTLMCTDNRLDPSPLVACNDCLYNYDPISNCTACLPGFCGPNCTTTPQNNPRVATCQANGSLVCNNNFDLKTNCTKCVDNYALTTNCLSCLFGYDINSGCTVCLLGQNISTRCTTCLSGFTGSKCEPDSSLSMGVVGGIAGGVGGVLLLIILVMAVLLILLTVRIRKSGNQDISTATTTDKEVTEVMEMNQNPVYSTSTTKTHTTDHEANHTHQYETVDTPIEMNQNPVYSETTGLGPIRNEQRREYDYIQV